VPCLRLGDVDDGMLIHPPPPGASDPAAARVFEEPLRQGEVLVSTLVSKPRLGYVSAAPPGDVRVTDHWQRFRFRETPGAWALVLRTAAVSDQLRRLARGAVQQFAHPGDLLRLLVPVPPLRLREEWQVELERCHRQQRALEVEWEALWAQALTLFRAGHAPP
jgi:hypothetical protein